tara:strand:+ start:235 stop:387 length:153 start_codon:yes stop_codon:yes gene_type:complete
MLILAFLTSFLCCCWLKQIELEKDTKHDLIQQDLFQHVFILKALNVKKST